MRKLIINFILNKPMKALKAIWDWLDGKKTKIAAGIGSFVIILTAFNDDFLIGIWHSAGIPHVIPIIASLEWIAGLLGGVGVVHGYAKDQAALKQNLDNANKNANIVPETALEGQIK